MKKKRYKVSLAMKVPANFEIETDAASETEAIKIAINKYHNGDYTGDNITDPDWIIAKLNIRGNNIGVYVEKLP
ncbi:MAG: hypothetical protein A2173_00520 [Planctomycetes bacterium RBG_13_44_8b]|nr:MAG: hypothetical protein A2173_00520 [Planctomycetes bacterium RBG_13_44_8b]